MSCDALDGPDPGTIDTITRLPGRDLAVAHQRGADLVQPIQQRLPPLGIDPERLLEEQAQDKEEADRLGLPFDSDPRADVSRQSKMEDDASGRVTSLLHAIRQAHPAAFHAVVETLAA